jgi:heptaprenyl diphosphate synthase
MPLRDDQAILKFSVAAVLIYLGESMIPKPLPWLRIGLANIPILIALIRYGLRAGFSVATTKVLAGAIITGKFLTPFFLFPLIGTFVSLIVMRLALSLPFSIVGVSILGAVTHNLSQLALALLLLLPFSSLRFLYPALSLLGIGTGLVTGYVGIKTLRLLYDETG